MDDDAHQAAHRERDGGAGRRGSAAGATTPDQPDQPDRPGRPGHLRGLLRLTFTNPLSLIYLSLVLAAALFALIDGFAVQHPDASFAGVWPLLLTAPTAVPLWLAGDALWGGSGAPDGYLMAATAVAALVNALLLGLVYRALRGRRTDPPGPAVSRGWQTREHGDH